MPAQRVYGLPEVARIEGMTLRGAQYWVRVRGIDCFRSGTGRIFLTEAQLEEFRAMRAASPWAWRRRRMVAASKSNGEQRSAVM